MRPEIDDDARQYYVEFPSELIDLVGHVSFVLHLAGDREINVGSLVDARERLDSHSSDHRRV